jgi:four helix bundle protein
MGSQPIRTFRDLDAWQAAMDLTVCAYRLIRLLPPTERFELSGQIRRAAVSVPANIAEGHCCGKDGRYLSHLGIAQGSLGELETELEIARRLGFITKQDYAEAERLLVRTGQVLHGLTRSVRRRRLERLGSRLSLLAVPLLPGLLFVFRQHLFALFLS